MVKTIFKIKGRSGKKPLQVFFPDLKTAYKYTSVAKDKKPFVAKLLPGQFTIIMKLKPSQKKKFSHLGVKDTIGVRIVKTPFLKSVMKRVKAPLAATSANKSGKKAPRKYRDIDKNLLAKAGFTAKDDGVVKGRASIILDFTGENIIILRR